MGHAAPFDFDDTYAPGAGVRRFVCGTPPVLGLAALEAALDVFADVDTAALFAKGQALCDQFIHLIEARCPGVTLATPRDPAARGSHVSLAHAHAWPIMAALIERGVIGDFRAPDLLRFGFTPLYTGFADVWRAVETLRQVLDSRAWEEPRFRQRAAVT